MKMFVRAVLALSLILLLQTLVMTSASANEAIGYNSTSCGSAPSPCFIQYGATIPIGGGTSPVPYLYTVVAGSQYQLLVSSATTLTVPATATFALVTVENNATYTSGVNCTVDGTTTPTSTKGTNLSAGASWWLAGVTQLNNFKCIQTAASASLDIEYLK